MSKWQRPGKIWAHCRIGQEIHCLGFSDKAEVKTHLKGRGKIPKLLAQQAFPLWGMCFSGWVANSKQFLGTWVSLWHHPNLAAFQKPQALSPGTLSRTPAGTHARWAGSRRIRVWLFKLWLVREQQLQALEQRQPLPVSSSVCPVGRACVPHRSCPGGCWAFQHWSLSTFPCWVFRYPVLDTVMSARFYWVFRRLDTAGISPGPPNSLPELCPKALSHLAWALGRCEDQAFPSCSHSLYLLPRSRPPKGLSNLLPGPSGSLSNLGPHGLFMPAFPWCTDRRFPQHLNVQWQLLAYGQ